MKDFSSIPKLIDDIAGGFVLFIYNIVLAVVRLVRRPLRTALRLRIQAKRGRQLSSTTLLFVGAIIVAAGPALKSEWLRSQVRAWSNGTWYSTVIAALIIFVIFDLTGRRWAASSGSPRRRERALDLIRYGAAATLFLLACVSVFASWLSELPNVPDPAQSIGIALALWCCCLPWLTIVWVLPRPPRTRDRRAPFALKAIKWAVVLIALAVLPVLTMFISATMGQIVRVVTDQLLSPATTPQFVRNGACVIRSDGTVAVALDWAARENDTDYVPAVFILSLSTRSAGDLAAFAQLESSQLIEPIPGRSSKTIQLSGALNPVPKWPLERADSCLLFLQARPKEMAWLRATYLPK